MPVRTLSLAPPGQQVGYEDVQNPAVQGVNSALSTLINLGPQLARIQQEKDWRNQELGLHGRQLDIQEQWRQEQGKNREAQVAAQSAERAARAEQLRSEAQRYGDQTKLQGQHWDQQAQWHQDEIARQGARDAALAQQQAEHQKLQRLQAGLPQESDTPQERAYGTASWYGQKYNDPAILGGQHAPYDTGVEQPLLSTMLPQANPMNVTGGPQTMQLNVAPSAAMPVDTTAFTAPIGPGPAAYPLLDAARGRLLQQQQAEQAKDWRPIPHGGQLYNPYTKELIGGQQATGPSWADALKQIPMPKNP